MIYSQVDSSRAESAALYPAENSAVIGIQTFLHGQRGTSITTLWWLEIPTLLPPSPDLDSYISSKESL